MHKDYDKNKQGKLDEQKKSYVDHELLTEEIIEEITEPNKIKAK